MEPLRTPHPGDWLRLDVSSLPESRRLAEAVLGLQEQILQSTMQRPGEFASVVVNALAEQLDLAAATMYIRCEELGAFKLKAATGFDYEAYESFLLPNPSYPSVACDSEQHSILLAVPPLDPTLFRDSRLLDDADIGGLLVVPFHPPGGSESRYPSPMGVLCLYPRKRTNLHDVAAISVLLERLVGTLYVNALEQLLMDLRSQVVKTAAFRNSLSDVSRRLLQLTKDHLHFEGGSLWLLDARREKLVLRAALPLARDDGLSLIQHEIRLDSLTNPIAAAYQHATEIHVLNRDIDIDCVQMPFDEMKVMEVLESPLENGVAYPLRPSGRVTLNNEHHECLGVMSVMNKYTQLGQVRHLLPMTWEDLRLLEHMCEIAAVLVFQSLRVQDHEAEYDRRLHGIKTNLIAVRDHLAALEGENIGEKVAPPYRYYASNALEWVREMEQQVGRHDRIERLTVQARPTFLYGAVLSKVFQQARTSIRANKVGPFMLIGQDSIATESGAIPAVHADERALLTVFRNLIENSVKYRRKSAPEFSIGVAVSPFWNDNKLTVHYWDNGIGIGVSERDLVFQDGYRGRAARRVHVHGGGIGLYESQSLMLMQGGTIRCDDPVEGNGAHFVLEIPLAISELETRRRR